jgi:hypothetical protein
VFSHGSEGRSERVQPQKRPGDSDPEMTKKGDRKRLRLAVVSIDQRLKPL